MSGYSAAAKLLENGYENILVLEAEGRLGGRVHSVQHGNGSIDLGAQWCHGEKDNAIFELVDKHFHFGRDVFEDSFDCLLSNGQSANQEDCVKLEKLLSKIFDNSEEARNVSVGSFVEQEYDKILKSEEYQPIDPKLAKSMKTYYGKQITGYYAADSWFNVSAYYNIYSQECEGNLALTWKTEGFKTVFEFLSVSFSFRKSAKISAEDYILEKASGSF